MRPYLGVAFIMAAALGLSAAACGGGSSYDSNPAGPSGQPTPAPTTSGPTPINIVGDRGSQSFTPNPASADQSRAIAWRNTDNVVHRIVANDGSFDTGNLNPGATSGTITLTTDGTNYHCSLHPGMIGAVNASGGAPPPCTGLYC
jgi:plastocyanin